MWSALHRRRLSSSQIILFGFALVILGGTLILMLPVSSRSGEASPFLDCLFTSTSAVCVTGLIVYDTATHWSVFGQAVILLLIQIGGMGVVTVAVAITMASGKRISLMQRSTMQDAISAPQVGGIVRFTGFILKGIAERAGQLKLSGAVKHRRLNLQQLAADRCPRKPVDNAYLAFVSERFVLILSCPEQLLQILRLDGDTLHAVDYLLCRLAAH